MSIFGSLFVLLVILPVTTTAQEGGDKISIEELSKSKAAILFQLGDYEQALEEFKKMSEEYPQDSLPKRYIGMTLTLLGRLDEAVTALQEAVQLDPQNPANHYFLARTYHEQGAREKAEQELNEVLRLDPEGFYGKPAKAAISIVQERARYKVSRPWEVFGSVGYEYDSNVTLEPNDKALGSTADQNANRYYFNLGGTYKWFEKGKFRSNAGYRIYQSLHDDGLDEFNFTFQEFSLLNEYRTKHFGKEVTYALRYGIPLGFLDGDIFSFGNQFTASVKARLTRNTRTEVYHKYTHYEFGPDGRSPSLTSRDGEYNATGFFHRFYFSNFSRWVFTGYIIEPVAVRGDNFDKTEHSVQVGLHTPLPVMNKTTLDVFGEFSAGYYRHFSAQLSRLEHDNRLDHNWTLVVSLTHPLSAHWAIRTSYRYINANNKNDLFQYDRHVGGVELRFRY